jgi:hypothetical protein
MEKKPLKLGEISSGLARQSESIANIHKTFSKIGRLTESEKAKGAIKELSGELETDEEAMQGFIAEGIMGKIWGELTHSTESVVELGAELKSIAEMLEKGNKISLIKELL